MGRSSTITHPKQPTTSWASYLAKPFVENAYTLIELMVYTGGAWTPVAYFTDLKVKPKAAYFSTGSSSVTVSQIGTFPLVSASSKQEFSFTNTSPKIGTMEFSFNVPWFTDSTAQTDVNTVYNMLNRALMGPDSLTKSLPWAFSIKSGFASYTGSTSVRDSGGQYQLSVSDWTQEYDLNFPFLTTSVEYDRTTHVFTVECEDSMGWFSRIDFSKILMATDDTIYKARLFSENNAFYSAQYDTWSIQYWYNSWDGSSGFTSNAIPQMIITLAANGGTYIDTLPLNVDCSTEYGDSTLFKVTPLSKEKHRSILDVIYDMAMVQRMKIMPVKQTSYTTPQYRLMWGNGITPLSYYIYRGSEKKDPTIKPISESLSVTSSSYYKPEVKTVYDANNFVHFFITYDQLMNTGAYIFTDENIHLTGLWNAGSDGKQQLQTVTCKCYSIDTDFTKVKYNTEFAITSSYDLGVIETYSTETISGAHRPVTVRAYCLGAHCLYVPPQTFPTTLTPLTDCYTFTSGTGTRYDVASKGLLIEVPIFKFTETKMNYGTGGTASTSDVGLFYTASDDTTKKTIAIQNHLCINAAEANECQRNASGAPYTPTDQISFTCRNDPSLAVGNIIYTAYYDKFIQVLITSIERTMASAQEMKIKGWVLSYTSISTSDYKPTTTPIYIYVTSSGITAATSWTPSAAANYSLNTVYYDLIQEKRNSSGAVTSTTTLLVTPGTSASVSLTSAYELDRFYLRVHTYGFDQKYQLTVRWNFNNEAKEYRYANTFKANESRYW